MQIKECDCCSVGGEGYDCGTEPIVKEMTQRILELAKGHLPEAMDTPLQGSDIDREAVDAVNALIASTRTARDMHMADCEMRHLAYAAAHDLRIPLRGISMIGEWLQRDYGGQLDEAGGELLALLSERTERMDQLIDGVLEYCKAGVIKVSPVNAHTLIEKLIDQVHCPDHITIYPEGPFPWVVADRARLLDVFRRILDNAIRYMDKPNGEISIRCMDDERTWIFSIEDNGPGMDADAAWEVFYIFHTLEPRHGKAGVGMGLALAKRVIEAHGGRIWIETEIDQGFTVNFTIPKNN